MVGSVGVGGANPIRVQSMITCDTMDTEMSIQETIELAAVGCEIVRITAPTVKDAWNRDAHRDESRLAQRSDPEPIRRHTARNGRERARVRADRARPRLSRVRLFDEIEQPESDDRGVSITRRAVRRRRPGLELS